MNHPVADGDRRVGDVLFLYDSRIGQANAFRVFHEKSVRPIVLVRGVEVPSRLGVIVPRFAVARPDMYFGRQPYGKERLCVIVVVAAEVGMGRYRWGSVQLPEIRFPVP